MVQPDLPPEIANSFDANYWKKYGVERQFILNVLGHMLSSASKHRGRRLKAGDEPAFASTWKKYFGYLVEEIATLNRHLSDRSTTPARIFACFFSLMREKDSELQAAHMNGCFAYLEMIGGMQAIIQGPIGPLSLTHIMRKAIFSNTISPARKQILGYYRYTDNEIREVLDWDTSAHMHCPLELQILIIRICRLRLIDASERPSAITAKHVRDLLDQISNVDLDCWPHKSEFTADYISSDTGLIFKLAIHLYGILALPHPAVMIAESSSHGACTHSDIVVRERRELMKRLRLAISGINYYPSLLWPFVVAGVASAFGDDITEDQIFIDQTLQKIWHHPNGEGSEISILEKLRRFWQSGNHKWDQCFDEAMCCNPLKAGIGLESNKGVEGHIGRSESAGSSVMKLSQLVENVELEDVTVTILLPGDRLPIGRRRRHYKLLHWFVKLSHRIYTVVRPELPGGAAGELRIQNPVPFIFNILDHVVKTASKARGRLLDLRQEPPFSAMWKNYLRYMGLHMQDINKTIREGHPNKTKVLRDIVLLVAADVTASSPLWQTHFEGAYAYLEHVGGVKGVLSEPYECSPLVTLFLSPLFCNTTSPARKQVTGYYRYSDSEIQAVFKNYLPSPDLHLPIDLKIVLVQITRCRVDAVTNLEQADTLKTRVLDIFQQLDAVDVTNWDGRDQYPPGYISRDSGFIFQLSIRLFAMMALPRAAVLEALHQDSSAEAWNELLAARRRVLINILKETYPAVKNTTSLRWPLLVAGVAATSGDDVEDHRTFVDKSLYEIWQHPLTNNEAFIILQKLREFWLSGKTEWEDCFNEPVSSG
ncbi:hypothetical protein NLG97_g7994 [Lecanicillium saksenae]|uniref:Uncharacterized protein n=1 Tax=Lecanicillium saksenae TaxID=468837 RepID=A0ACC1QK72_9HYPO|nr:hypothetical protein NLG97_g7994 [Lecanicillium saksenae]